MKLKQAILLLTLLSVGLVSCKKKVDPTPEPDTNRANLTRDSIFLYAKQIYLWSDALPSQDAFNPRKYTTESTDFLNYEKELIALAQYKINPATGLPYEYYQYLVNGVNVIDSKYSYISDIANKNPTAFIPEKKSVVDLEGNGNDFGLKLGAYGQGGTTFALFVTGVFQNSPADKAGVVRSDRIYKLNGRNIGDNSNTDLPIINTALSGSSPITIEGVHYTDGLSGAPFTYTLNKASYKSSPVFAKKVFTAGAKKIGYLAYARFSNLSTNSKADFDLAFSEFSAAGVSDLIIDLRYNGGGYVNTAQYLINQIAPASANGKVMFAEYYNPLMQANGATILANQPLLDANKKVQYQNGKMITYADVNYSVASNTELFVKAGPLNNDNKISNVIFIVTGNTASASELVINCLKPYMNVKVVGTKTYGKPVGFFPITIENKYEVYYSLFQTKNALGQGDYFDGMQPDVVFTDAIRGDLDDPRNNFGDPNEYYTSVALNQIAPGAVVSSAAKTMSIQGRNVSIESLQPMKPIGSGNEFVGMIETRHKLKK
ncbi:S41 family peptidase [Pedobacter sp. Du54]|uniref:S41 family peptidase n=1 Tax=Pedobacter anseongensis TaxID=3133439 RepID=UPI0030B3D4F0